ncbi:MAG: tripartite tricarboxylate transporter substrate binding protein [Alphaproteobacteria bacterium]|nr:tripartite tricarboxylate transporter substrate binding protein [Alphaproteobacteria bacterium]
MRTITRRTAITAGTAAAFAAIAAPAKSQAYPDKPIRVLVPAQAGGIGDILPRILGQKLAESGTATVVVENRVGGGGTIAGADVARATPDGYLLLLGNQGLLAIRPQLAKVAFDPLKDFAPVILMVTVPNILLVHPSVPAKNLKELIALAKADPGKLTYASQGIGASGHIAGELFKLSAGIDITHVPYRGAAPAAKDLAAGHVHMMFDVVSLALGPIRSGAVRPIGVAAKERVSVLPDVPTLGEQGFPDEIGAWFGLLAPAGTPPAIVSWLNRESNRVFAMPDARRSFIDQGASMPLGTPEAFRGFIASQFARFGDVIQRAGIKL